MLPGLFGYAIVGYYHIHIVERSVCDRICHTDFSGVDRDDYFFRALDYAAESFVHDLFHAGEALNVGVPGNGEKHYIEVDTLKVREIQGAVTAAVEAVERTAEDSDRRFFQSGKGVSAADAAGEDGTPLVGEMAGNVGDRAARAEIYAQVRVLQKA